MHAEIRYRVETLYYNVYNVLIMAAIKLNLSMQP